MVSAPGHFFSTVQICKISTSAAAAVFASPALRYVLNATCVVKVYYSRMAELLKIAGK